MTNEEIEALARKRANAKYGFYIHATVFCLVNIGLLTINLFSSTRPWSLAPFLGWGLGLAIHGLVTFSRVSLSDMKQRMVDAEIRKLKDKM